MTKTNENAMQALMLVCCRNMCVTKMNEMKQKIGTMEVVNI